MSLSSLIIFFASLLLLGVISIIVRLCGINRDRKDIRLFVEKAAKLKDAELSRKDPAEWVTFILANYQEVSRTIGEDEYKLSLIHI